jgi:hypothetical protein
LASGKATDGNNGLSDRDFIGFTNRAYPWGFTSPFPSTSAERLLFRREFISTVSFWVYFPRFREKLPEESGGD